MATLRIKPLAVLCFLTLIFMMNLLLITKVHYVVDLVGGLVFAIWYYWISGFVFIYFDKFMSLPFFAVKWIYENKCKDEEEPQENIP